MTRRAAVVDIGSGSTTLAVFEAGNGGFLDRIHQEGASLRLIEKLDARGRLPAAASRELLTTVDGFLDRAHAEGAAQVEIVATSAMRDAGNGEALVAKLGARPNVRARLVTGEEEGRLAAHTAMCTLPFRSGVVLDLGGGSLQLVLVRARKVISSVSLPLGALRLYDQFLFRQEVPSADALCALRHHVLEQLRTIPWLRSCGESLVAVGGSVRTLAKIERKRQGWPVGHGHGYRLDGEALLDAYERLSRASPRERTETPGLPAHRVDTIVTAALTLSTVLRFGGFGAVHLSTYGIREGVAFRALFGEAPISDPGGAGLRGRLRVVPLDRPPAAPGLTLRERRLYAAAMDRPIAWLLDKPIQGFWQEEVLRVARVLEAERSLR